MKRKVALLLTLCMALVCVLAGCGGGTPAPTASAADTAAATQAETTTSAPETAAAATTAAAAEATPETATEAPVETTDGTGGLPTTFQQSPFLDGKSLPAVADRLPKEPKLTNEMAADQLTYEIGTYGGTLHTVTQALDWDADLFVMNNEPLLNTPGILGEEVTGNVLKGYEASADQKEFTFYLREGLKWSDGEPVTMDDFKFAINDVLFNTTYTPTFPAWLCSGGVAEGTPMKFEVIDDWTFKISFDQPYGGFPIRLAIKGWVGYSDLVKPAHYMKAYHKDYATEEQIDAACDKFEITKDENKYTALFSRADITNWELTSVNSIGFPVLYPWIYVKKEGSVAYYERNPYYFKIDTAGNQLPYIDTLQSTVVQDIEMVALQVASGTVDFCRESAALVNMATYKENEDKGITAYLCSMHVTPTDIFLNQTYADDTYRSVVQDVRFRKALNMAIDRATIIDQIYYGYAEPTSWQAVPLDVAGANALLDEMGMKKGSDGIRTAPDGKAFSVTISTGAQATDMVPLCELLVEQWGAPLGLNVKMERLESSLWSTRNAANELQATMIWTHTPLWYMQDFLLSTWCPLWNTYMTTAGKEGEQPPADVQEFSDLINKILVVSPEEGKQIFDQCKQSMNDNIWYFSYIMNVKQPLVCNSKLGNISDKGFAIAANFSGEQFFYKQ